MNRPLKDYSEEELLADLEHIEQMGFDVNVVRMQKKAVQDELNHRLIEGFERLFENAIGLLDGDGLLRAYEVAVRQVDRNEKSEALQQHKALLKAELLKRLERTR